MIGMIVQMLADGAGHAQTQIGVDVDLTDGHLGSLTQHFLGDADGIGHGTAVLVDHLDKLLRHGRAAVKDDGEIGQALAHFFQNVKPQLGLGAGLELISTVAGADGNGQRVYAGAGDELFHLGRIGEHGVGGRDVHIVLDTGQLAQLAFHNDTAGVSIFHNLLGDGDVLFKAVLAAVDHDGRKTTVDAGLTDLKTLAVIQMQGDGQVGVGDGSFHQLGQVDVLGILAGTGRHLQNDGRLLQLGSFGDTLDDFHIIDVESTDGVTAGIGFLEHFFCRDQRHR